MLDLNFNVKNQILERTDKQVLVNKSRNYLECNFNFTTDDWEGLSKVAIFKNSFGESFTSYLGNDRECNCMVPSPALVGDYFKVSIYGGDLITTNEKTVVLIPAGYTTEISEIPEDSADIFVQIFDQIEERIDNVIFNEGHLEFLSGENVLVDVELTVDNTLSLTSTNPVMNNVITSALNGKADAFDFVEELDITIENLIGRQ